MRTNKLFATTLCMLMLSGCVYDQYREMGYSIQGETLSRIIKGETTEEKLEDLMGIPDEKVEEEDGRIRWTYQHYFMQSGHRVLYVDKHEVKTTLTVYLLDGIVVDYKAVQSYTNG